MITFKVSPASARGHVDLHPRSDIVSAHASRFIADRLLSCPQDIAQALTMLGPDEAIQETEAAIARELRAEEVAATAPVSVRDTLAPSKQTHTEGEASADLYPSFLSGGPKLLQGGTVGKQGAAQPWRFGFRKSISRDRSRDAKLSSWRDRCMDADHEPAARERRIRRRFTDQGIVRGENRGLENPKPVYVESAGMKATCKLRVVS